MQGIQADILKVFASKGLVKILHLLATEGRKNISAITKEVKINHSNVAAHLKRFVEQEFVMEEKMGPIRYFVLCGNERALALKRFVDTCASLQIDFIGAFESKAHAKILRVLVEFGELNISDIVEKTALNHENVTCHLKQLCSQNLVKEKTFGRIKIFQLRTEVKFVIALKQLVESWENIVFVGSNLPPNGDSPRTLPLASGDIRNVSALNAARRDTKAGS